MQADKNHAVIMTNTGEFLKLKVSETFPKPGEIYTGELAKSTPFYKYALTAATLTFLLLFGSTAYAYYSPVASVTVNINPSIKLDLNRWNKIIKSTPLNEDGKKVLSELNIKNKNLNDALASIVDQAKKDNFINKAYIEKGKTITINIDSSKPLKNLKLSDFEEHIKSDNLNMKINTSVNHEVKDTLDISSSKGNGNNSNRSDASKKANETNNSVVPGNNKNPDKAANNKGNGKSKAVNKNTASGASNENSGNYSSNGNVKDTDNENKDISDNKNSSSNSNSNKKGHSSTKETHKD